MYVYYATLCTFVLCKSKKDQRYIKEKYIQHDNYKFKNTAQVRIKKQNILYNTLQYSTEHYRTVQYSAIK